jgi:hypothetical protein
MHPIIQTLQNVQTTVKDTLDKILTPRSRKIIKYCILIFLIIAFIPEIYIIPYYFVIIKPGGETEINQILNRAQIMNTTEEKVITISDWQEQNFTNIYGLHPNISLDFGWYPFFGTGRYPVYINASNQQPLKIRAIISPFTNDPNWITYFHCGACGELAELFYHVTNKSQIESRLVQTTGEDHAWVEVKINDSWMYFDPTLVEIFQRNSEFRNRWFSKPENFESAWSWNVSRVTVSSTQEDITMRYTKVVNVFVNLTSTKYITISKYDTGKKGWISLFSRVISSSNSQTHEEIQVGESNRYKIRASNYGEGYLPIPMYQEHEFFQNTTSNISFNMNPNEGSVDIAPSIGIFGFFLIVIVIEIKWIWGWLQKEKPDRS